MPGGKLCPCHTFLCKKWLIVGPHIFKSLQRILMNFYVFTKFGMINRAARFIFCLKKRDIGNRSIRLVYMYGSFRLERIGRRSCHRNEIFAP